MYADFFLFLEKRTEWLFSNIQQIIAIVVPLFCHPHSSSVIVLRTTQYAISLNVSGSWTVCVCVFFLPNELCERWSGFKFIWLYFSHRYWGEYVSSSMHGFLTFTTCLNVALWVLPLVRHLQFSLLHHLWQNNVNVECVVMTTLHISYVQLTKYWFVWYLELLNTDTPAIRPNCAPQYILSYLKLYV